MKKLILMLVFSLTISLGFAQGRDEDWVQEANNSGKPTIVRPYEQEIRVGIMIFMFIAVPVALVFVIRDKSYVSPNLEEDDDIIS